MSRAIRRTNSIARPTRRYDDEFVEHLKDLASETPVIQLVNQLIQRSLDLGASDIHLESVEEGLRVRYRVDGVLQDGATKVEERLSAAVISRIKLLANLNIAERRFLRTAAS